MQTLHPIRHFTDLGPNQSRRANCGYGRLPETTPGCRPPGGQQWQFFRLGATFVRPVMRRLPGETPCQSPLHVRLFPRPPDSRAFCASTRQAASDPHVLAS